MVTRGLLVLWLTVVWCALWGQASAGNIAAGLVLSTLVVVIFPPGAERGGRPRPVAIVRFGLYFAWALIVSNLTVAYQVLRPKGQIAEAIVAVPLRVRSPIIVAFVANAITLTPGTMTIEVLPSPPEVDEWDADGEPVPTPELEPDEPVVLFVHCLAVTDPEEVRTEGLHLEEMAVAAFGTPADRAAVLDPPPPWPPAAAAPAGTDDAVEPEGGAA